MNKIPQNAPSNAEEVADLWGAFCGQLESIGRDVITRYANDSTEHAVEAISHLARLTRTSLEWQLESADPKNPRLMWYDRTCAGSAPFAPNIDNTYLLVRVDSSESYRLRLDVDAIDEINISIHTGSPYDGNTAVYGDLNLADLDIHGTQGEIVFSRSRHAGAWFELPEGAEYVFIRFYYFDWDRTEPPAIEFERLGPAIAPLIYLPPLQFAEGLARTAHWLEGVMRFGYKTGQWFLEGGQPNVPGPLNRTPGGGSKIRYGALRYELQEDEALIVEFERPEARYWSIQWQRMPWGNPIDSFHHLMSLNHTQARVDEDDRVRVVIAHRDPGVQNWLDTAQRPDGLVIYRWIWSTTEPLPTAQVVKLKDVSKVLPASTPAFSVSERSRQISRRRRHLSRRY